MTVATPADTQIPAVSVASDQPLYLDCNATTPVDPRIQHEILRYMAEDFGNAGSRTHSYGQIAKERVNQARQQIADVVAVAPDEVIFTSGATESNNLAILGLAPHGELTGRRHIISTQIEHKSVLEPLQSLAARGFDVTLLRPTKGGWIEPEQAVNALRPDTLLISVMATNNETGVSQPLSEISAGLTSHDAFFHVDGAQAFGKNIDLLRNSRIDMISVSGHKIYAPKGIGALVLRKRGYRRVPLKPLMYGGGQERGLRPGTLPVPLIAGLGEAAAMARQDHRARAAHCAEIKRQLTDALSPLGITLNGDPARTVPHTVNFSVPGIDAEAAIIALKDIVAVSNGSACTSHSYDPSHVLAAMDLPAERIAGALRFSWCHLTPTTDWSAVADRLSDLISL